MLLGAGLRVEHVTSEAEMRLPGADRPATDRARARDAIRGGRARLLDDDAQRPQREARHEEARPEDPRDVHRLRRALTPDDEFDASGDNRRTLGNEEFVDDLRVRVFGDATVSASALRYDAECNREVAASFCARARRARHHAAELRDEGRAVRAQANLARSRAIALVQR
jgi:hypothetical protein